MRDGGSAALLVRGEPGVGKSALLDRVIDSASGFRVVRAVGVEGEVDLPYAGLHQLCRSMIDTLDVLPPPQRDALLVAFGLSSGEAADRFFVGLAALTLMSEVASNQPLLCVMDDAQWLDVASRQALAFVARRLGADSVALVFASRLVVEDLRGVRELHLECLDSADARVLFDSVVVGRLDPAVRERLLAESSGNPLALIELARALTPAEAATGLVRQPGNSLSTHIEDGFRRRLEPLPEDTRRFLVLASAEPLGDPLLLLRAAAQLRLGVEAADAAEEAGLFQIRERCSFRHPLVRSAVYGAATARERRMAHAALAEATDPGIDPDRKAWHRAQATARPDENVAADLERTAVRARSRGGLTAAGAFLERAATLSPDPGKRARRALAAAELMYESGAFDAAGSLLRALDSAQLDQLDAARAECLDAEVSISVGRPDEATVQRLLAAAAQLSRLDSSLAHEAYFLCLDGATHGGKPEIISAVARALSEFPSSVSGEPAELFARGWAQLLEHGYPSGTNLLRETMALLRDKPHLDDTDLDLLHHVQGVAVSTWDFDSWESLTRRAVKLARDMGALRNLPLCLNDWGMVKVAAGEFAAAAAAIAEADAVAEATRERLGCGDGSWLDAWRLDEPEALQSLERHERRAGKNPYHYDHARALVYNGAGRYEAALDAAQRSCDRHPLGTYTWALVELVEAAARCGQTERARDALQRLVERTRPSATDWALGLEARCAALLNDDPVAAEGLHHEAIERLARARTRPDLARAHLVYGEWLRREKRRLDAREQLRTAHDLFDDIGIPGFADRAHRELAATGVTARKRTDDTRADLTAQELNIAQLASEGLTNPEIGAQLFLSPRTVEWHLRSVYPKLGISSRKELRTVLHPT